MKDKGIQNTSRTLRGWLALTAVAVMASGCWLDFRKRVTLSYEEHEETYAWKAEQKGLLASYDVVDAEAGTYQIPVAAAIAMVAKDPGLLEPVIELQTDLSGMSLVQKGEQHFKITYACAGCHSMEGARLVGPALNKRWGGQALLEGDEQVAFDETYFRESVFYSRNKIARGYPPAMPVFDGIMSEEDYEAIKAYVMTYQ
ncbi:MAG: cytochrome c [Myxococcota bacterium]